MGGEFGRPSEEEWDAINKKSIETKKQQESAKVKIFNFTPEERVAAGLPSIEEIRAARERQDQSDREAAKKKAGEISNMPAIGNSGEAWARSMASRIGPEAGLVAKSEEAEHTAIVERPKGWLKKLLGK